jgi:hypothetical protein
MGKCPVKCPNNVQFTYSSKSMENKMENKTKLDKKSENSQSFL